MIETPDITRPSAELIAALAEVGSATASGELYKLGITNPHLRGLTPRMPGKCVVGPARPRHLVTLRKVTRPEGLRCPVLTSPAHMPATTLHSAATICVLYSPTAGTRAKSVRKAPAAAPAVLIP